MPIGGGVLVGLAGAAIPIAVGISGLSEGAEVALSQAQQAALWELPSVLQWAESSASLPGSCCKNIHNRRATRRNRASSPNIGPTTRQPQAQAQIQSQARILELENRVQGLVAKILQKSC